MASFEEALRLRGFEQIGEREWRGPIPVPGPGGGRPKRPHVVVINPGFPFEPPKVRPDPPLKGPHWHMERDGFLCLYPRGENVGRPWDDLDQLFAKVEDWHRQQQAGWPEDPGDLDLERYFSKVSTKLVAYDDLDAIVGRRLDIHKRDSGLYVVEPGRPLRTMSPKQAKRERREARRGTMWGAGVRLGAIDKPVNDWKSVTGRLDPETRKTLWNLARTRGHGIIVAEYSRAAKGGIVTGAAALLVNETPTDPRDPPSLTALQVEDRGAARRNRTGTDALTLKRKSVAVIGCGAIGSFLTEQLARSGIGRLTLVDGEFLRHGNCVRHLADETYVNQAKTRAVKDILARRNLMSRSTITSIPKSLTPEIAFDLFQQHDLIIDATADSRARDILDHFGFLTEEQWVRVALHRDGAVVRADRFGPGTAEPDNRPPPIKALPGTAGVRETGCGDPVSPTPPSAVHSAAGLACRLAVDTLRSRRQRQFPDSIIEVLRPNPAPADDPYRRIGVVTG